MGISSSNLKSKLLISDEFKSAIDKAYNDCRFLTQQAFDGVFPYQLPTASAAIHSSLTSPLFRRWLPSPPTRSQIDKALRVIRPNSTVSQEGEEEPVLGSTEFREWAAVLFSEAVVDNARGAIVKRVPIGAAGIVGVVGIGAALRGRRDMVAAVGLAGVYVVGFAASVLLSLSV